MCEILVTVASTLERTVNQEDWGSNLTRADTVMSDPDVRLMVLSPPPPRANSAIISKLSVKKPDGEGHGILYNPI